MEIHRILGDKVRIRLHLKPFFGNRLLSEITEGSPRNTGSTA